MKQALFSVGEVSAMIREGKKLLPAGDTKFLAMHADTKALMQFFADQMDEFLARSVIFQKNARKSGGRGYGILLLDAPHHHAKVLRLNYHCHSHRR